MNIATTLEKRLCSTFCEAISVNAVPCGYAVSSAFKDASGDRLSFYVIAEGENYRLEDDGEYLARLVALGIDFEKGQRQQLLDSVLQTADAFWDHDTYEIRTGQFTDQELSGQMIRFLSALIRVRDLELLTRDFVRSTFREDATAAIMERFSAVATIEQRKPVANRFPDFIPDLVIRPKQTGRDTAIFLASSIVPFQEAELLRGEVEKEAQQGNIAVIALIEDTDKIALISPRRFQRAQNRGLTMPIFRGDEAAALSSIERQLKMAA
jgi:hypothetical protein